MQNEQNGLGLRDKGDRLKYMFDSLVRLKKKYERLKNTRGLTDGETQHFEEVTQKLASFTEKCRNFIRPRKNSVGKFSVDDYVNWYVRGQGTKSQNKFSSVSTAEQYNVSSASKTAKEKSLHSVNDRAFFQPQSPYHVSGPNAMSSPSHLADSYTPRSPAPEYQHGGYPPYPMGYAYDQSEYGYGAPGEYSRYYKQRPQDPHSPILQSPTDQGRESPTGRAPSFRMQSPPPPFSPYPRPSSNPPLSPYPGFAPSYDPYYFQHSNQMQPPHQRTVNDQRLAQEYLHNCMQILEEAPAPKTAPPIIDLDSASQPVELGASLDPFETQDLSPKQHPRPASRIDLDAELFSITWPGDRRVSEVSPQDAFKVPVSRQYRPVFVTRPAVPTRPPDILTALPRDVTDYLGIHLDAVMHMSAFLACEMATSRPQRVIRVRDFEVIFDLLSISEAPDKPTTNYPVPVEYIQALELIENDIANVSDSW